MQNRNRGGLPVEWHQGVELGARGYVCAGEAIVNDLSSSPRADAALLSLCASTRASWIRQSGRHAQAAPLDGVAASLAFNAVDAQSDPVALAALADALTGLAADNLGAGRFAASRRLLDRVETEVLPAVDPASEFVYGQRLELRWRWVRTELALYSGDPGGAAESSAAGVELAASAPSQRHRIKTDLIAAAAAAVNGDVGEATALATSCERRCAAAGLLPLQWAALTMLGGLALPPERGRVDDAVAVVVAELGRRGMYL